METQRYMENIAGQIKDTAILNCYTMNNKNGSQRPLFIENEQAVKTNFKLNSVATLKREQHSKRLTAGILLKNSQTIL